MNMLQGARRLHTRTAGRSFRLDSGSVTARQTARPVRAWLDSAQPTIVLRFLDGWVGVARLTVWCMAQMPCSTAKENCPWMYDALREWKQRGLMIRGSGGGHIQLVY